MKTELPPSIELKDIDLIDTVVTPPPNGGSKKSCNFGQTTGKDHKSTDPCKPINIAVFDDEKQIIFVTAGGEIYKWDSIQSSSTCLFECREDKNNKAKGIVVHGKLLISGHEDGSIRIWNLNTCKLLDEKYIINIARKPITCVTVYERRIICGHKDGSISLIHLNNLNISKILPNRGAESPIYSINGYKNNLIVEKSNGRMEKLYLNENKLIYVIQSYGRLNRMWWDRFTVHGNYLIYRYSYVSLVMHDLTKPRCKGMIELNTLHNAGYIEFFVVHDSGVIITVHREHICTWSLKRRRRSLIQKIPITIDCKDIIHITPGTVFTYRDGKMKKIILNAGL